ncbi:MAG: rhodanese-related sulfurtransferase [Sphingomonadales bacterium]|nr:MAG: rhodanese-related sulfurtransferase [Sphingomonadales bacterium]
MSGPVVVAAGYVFARLDDPAMARAPLRKALAAAGVKGTVLLAPEGMNTTFAGPRDAVDTGLAALRALPGCAGFTPRESLCATMPFGLLKVKVKREIVTLGVESVDPVNRVGTYVPPRDWNALLDEPGVVVIDTRNDYEIAVGSFDGAIDPRTPRFRDFPAWVSANRATLESARKIAMFCTGGIRCEKATAYMRDQGFDNVYHLQGGILNYLETVPAADSRWRGGCFVFDERGAVGSGLAPMPELEPVKLLPGKRRIMEE